MCRAQISAACEHGMPSRDVYDVPGATMATTDDSWDGWGVVCTPCHVALAPYTPSGRGLKHELDEAIETARIVRRLNER